MPSKYEVIKERRENDPEYASKLKAYAEKYKNKNSEKEKDRQRKSKKISREKNREAYNEYMRKWARKNSETINAKRRERRKSNPEIAKRDNERRKSQYDPEHHRDAMLKNNYGISLDEYKEMYAAQEGKCAICEAVKPDHGKSGLVVDHCHTHGHVRMLLCFECNTGLGRFKDDVRLLAKAIDYLNRSVK